MNNCLVSLHAVNRWIERVDSRLTRRQALEQIEEFVSKGSASARPRQWMKNHRASHGRSFVYWHEYPGVALVVRDGAVMTVLSKKALYDGRRR